MEGTVPLHIAIQEESSNKYVDGKLDHYAKLYAHLQICYVYVQ